MRDDLACALVTMIVVLLGVTLVLIARLMARFRESWLLFQLSAVPRIFGWFLIGSALSVGACAFLHGIPLMLLILFVVVMVIGGRRTVVSQQYALLGLLTIASERGMPLPPVIRAFARERGGRIGRRANRLADFLVAGQSLPDALRACPRTVPRRAIPIIHVGCATDALAPALRQAAVARGLMVPFWETLLPKLGYVCFLPCYGFVIVTFIMLKIVPQYENIFKDFGSSLPPLTVRVIACGRWVGEVWYLFAPLVLITGLLLFLFRSDLWGRFARRLDTAAILDALALVARQQRPLSQAIAVLADCYPRESIRRGLGRVLFEVTGGRECCESLRGHGLLGAADMAVLQAAARVGNLPWALHEMADSNRRRFAYRGHALVQVGFPLVVLAFGAVVMFIVVGLFLPLIALIAQLAGH